MDQSNLALVAHPASTGPERQKAGSDLNTVVLNNQALTGSSVRIGSAVATPRQVFERSKWQRRYTAYLQMTDTLGVCAAVVLAQSVRFGTFTPPGYPNYYVPAFSALFAIGWLAALAGFHTRSPRLIGAGVEEYRRVVAASFLTFGAIAIVTQRLKLEIARG